MTADLGEVTLQVLHNGKQFFQSKGKWLYPIFEPEDYLIEYPVDTALLEVHDKVIGKAAALLFIRLGVGCVYGNLMSELADAVLCNACVPHFYKEMVERINCQTEALLLEIDDVNVAHAILRKRANRG